MLLWLNRICPAGAATVQIPGKAIGLPALRDASIEMPPAYERRPGTRSPRVGGALWHIEAAYLRDLEGLTSLELAETIEAGDLSEQDGRGRSRTSDRWVKHGRELLHELGAWPWAVVDGGKLPRDWRTDERITLALALWHRIEWGRTARQLRASCAPIGLP